MPLHPDHTSKDLDPRTIKIEAIPLAEVFEASREEEFGNVGAEDRMAKRLETRDQLAQVLASAPYNSRPTLKVTQDQAKRMDALLGKMQELQNLLPGNSVTAGKENSDRYYQLTGVFSEINQMADAMLEEGIPAEFVEANRVVASHNIYAARDRMHLDPAPASQNSQQRAAVAIAVSQGALKNADMNWVMPYCEFPLEIQQA